MKFDVSLFPEGNNMWLLGLNSAYHEPAACLMRNGEIVAAAEEERFNRVRHGKTADLVNADWLPERAIRYCLDEAGIEASDLSAIGFSFVPEKRLAHNVGLEEDATPGCAGTREGEELFYRSVCSVPEKLGALLGEDVQSRFHFIDHHLCHAASAFYVSPFENAAVMSVDGIGEATSIWLGRGNGNKLEPIREITYPNSLGMLWTKASRFLGFGEYGQWKVMGLAAFGDPDRYYEAFRRFVHFDSEGNLHVDGRYLQLRVDRFAGFQSLFGRRRLADEDIEDRYADFAASLQRLTNEALLALSRYLHGATSLSNLCYAGGVALNCVANRVILEEGPFDDVFIQPAANDAGTALGACYYRWNHVLDRPRAAAMSDACLGPEFSSGSIASELGEFGLPLKKVDDIEMEVAALLARGEIVAWFQGRMEFGPRALGNRSILADPRQAHMAHLINDKIKHREYFRPFAASVLSDRAQDWFVFGKRSSSDAFMLVARPVLADKLGRIPAVTHLDGTTRVQCVDAQTNPRFYRLIDEFRKLTGVPLLLNTSFNDQDPIICTPEDAISTCRKAGIRYLAIADYLVDFQESAVVSPETSAVTRPSKRDPEQAPTAPDSPRGARVPVALAFRSR